MTRWGQRQYARSQAALQETVARLTAQVAAMEQDPTVTDDTYDAVRAFLEGLQAAQQALTWHGETKDWTTQEWQEWRMMQQNIDESPGRGVPSPTPRPRRHTACEPTACGCTPAMVMHRKWWPSPQKKP